MLEELANVRQVEGEPRRRWFQDDHMDLIVWADAKAAIQGFQLCYDKSVDEHAITWWKEKGFTHHRVDDGEGRQPQKATPVLEKDGAFPKAQVIARFKKAAEKIDPRVASFVAAKLADY